MKKTRIIKAAALFLSAVLLVLAFSSCDRMLAGIKEGLGELLGDEKKDYASIVANGVTAGELDNGGRWFAATVSRTYSGGIHVFPLENSNEHAWSGEGGFYVTTRLVSGESADGAEVGDTVVIEYDGSIAESYPGQIFTVYDIVVIKIAVTESGDNAEVPDDFSFSLVWGVFGISSYDSKTGKLVKTTDATDPDDFVTYYHLTDKDRAYVYGLIQELDINSYPDTYNPMPGMMSEPSATLILTVFVDGEEKTVRAEDISLMYRSDNEKGQAFLDTCSAISNMLTETEEWKALPPYETLYE